MFPINILFAKKLVDPVPPLETETVSDAVNSPKLVILPSLSTIVFSGV